MVCVRLRRMARAPVLPFAGGEAPCLPRSRTPHDSATEAALRAMGRAILLLALSASASQAVPRFQKIVFDVGESYTCLALGPDGRLYAGTVHGKIKRFDRASDGTKTGSVTITTLQTAEGGTRALLGMAFDPAATALNPILWIAHSYPGVEFALDWKGKISRLSGPTLGTIQDFVVNLPRSTRDHMTNGIAFGPDSALYVCQGSNTTMGATDPIWSTPERLLSAAVLRVNLGAITTPPLNVQTEEGGSYDPFATGAPLTIYASGLRNPYDLVWHTNGRLYVPTNGSTSGGNTPASPAPLPPECSSHRIDSAANGPYSGPQVAGLTNVTGAQGDFLYRIQQNGYYGHPNHTRCEWTMNGGNPTAGSDSAEVSEYSTGTTPDRNWRGFSFDFGLHRSPNGVIEYRSNVFGTALMGKLLVVRYSQGDDIIVLTPGGPNQDIVDSETGIEGFTAFTDPLDLVEDRGPGYIYVAEPAPKRIRLLRPLPEPTAVGDPSQGSSGRGSRLAPMAPNPTMPGASIRFFLAVAGPTRLEIYGPGGELVRTIVQEHRTAGWHTVTWNGTDHRSGSAPTGVYFVRLIAPDRSDTRTVTLLK